MTGMGKTKLTIYHNENCSKSCAAYDSLKTAGIEFEVVNYLQEIPSVAQLKDIIEKLGCSPIELIRTGEEIFKEKFADKNLSEEEWIMAMHNYPILIQRPIVFNGNKAILARNAGEIDWQFMETDN
jgi:arsenate reductase